MSSQHKRTGGRPQSSNNKRNTLIGDNNKREFMPIDQDIRGKGKAQTKRRSTNDDGDVQQDEPTSQFKFQTSSLQITPQLTIKARQKPKLKKNEQRANTNLRTKAERKRSPLW